MTRKRLVRSLLVVNGTVALVVVCYFLVFMPLVRLLPGIRSVCLIHEVLHLYCPACGGTRAAQALLSLRLSDAWMSNPAVPLGALTILYYDGLMIASLIAGKGFYLDEKVRKISGKVALWGILSAVVVFTVVRDVLLVSGTYDYFGELIGFWR